MKQVLYIDAWKDYNEISLENRKTIVPLVLMLQRWDGTIGFIGGKIDPDENIFDTIIR